MPVDTSNSCVINITAFQRSRHLLTLHTTVLTLVGILIILVIFGNWLVITSILKFKKMRSVQNILLFSLAVCDSLIALLILPSTLAYELLDYWPFGQIACRIYLLLDIALCTGSIWILCMISVNRYVALKLGVKYRDFNTLRTGVKINVIIWFCSILACLPALKATATVDYATCSHSRELWFILYSVSISFYIPMFVMCVMYVRLLWDFDKKIKVLTVQSASLKKEKTMQRLCGITMTAFFICWFPFFQTYIVSALCPQCCVPSLLMRFFEWFGYVNCALNPIIYSSTQKEFRRAFRLILKSRARVNPDQNHVSQGERRERIEPFKPTGTCQTVC